MNTVACFFAGIMGLGGPELLLIFAMLMLLFGGSKLPALAKGLGKSIKEFKQASRDEPEPVSSSLRAASASEEIQAEAAEPQAVTARK